MQPAARSFPRSYEALTGADSDEDRAMLSQVVAASTPRQTA
jgi:hypothetical protein